MKHRPARAKNDDVRAHRIRIINQHNADPPPMLPRRPNPKVTFKQDEPAQTPTVHPQLALTAAERAFVNEDNWHQVEPHSRHSVRTTRPTTQQVREALQIRESLNEGQQQNESPCQRARKTHQLAAVARRIAHESRRHKAAIKRGEQARREARDDDRLNAALPAVLQARKEAKQYQKAQACANSAQSVTRHASNQ